MNGQRDDPKWGITAMMPPHKKHFPEPQPTESTNLNRGRCNQDQKGCVPSQRERERERVQRDRKTQRVRGGGEKWVAERAEK